MVHQHFTLADNLTVLDNVTLGTEPLWRARSQRTAARARLAELSETFGLAVKPDARIADLSVGERQRVEILKALYRDARILILDEPTAVLTPQETEALFATLQKLVARGLADHLHLAQAARGDGGQPPRRRAAPGQAGGRAAHGRDGSSRAGRADGRPPDPGAEGRADSARAGRAVVASASRWRARGGRCSRTSRSICTATRSSASPACPATARARSPISSAASSSRPAARSRCSARRSTISIPRAWWPMASRASRRTAMPSGWSATCRCEENLISARYREPPFSRRGLIDWKAVRDVRDPHHRQLRRALPGAAGRHAAAVRRQHAEADPGARDGAPARASSSPTSRPAASTSARSAMSTSSC